MRMAFTATMSPLNSVASIITVNYRRGRSVNRFESDEKIYGRLTFKGRKLTKRSSF